MNPLVVAALTGCLLGFGAWAVLAARLAPIHPRLADSLDLLDGRLTTLDPGVGTDRLGSWLQRRLPRPLSEATLRRLRMIDRTPQRHFTHKAVGALAGLILPLFLAALAAPVLGLGATVVAAAAPLCGLAGLVAPDLLLAVGDKDTTSDATEALLSYFDLVTLERLANRSGSQSLRAAAAVSDLTVFAAISDALERARLEQRPPYAELKRLGAELALPALVDVADVMSLDESGASLADALRARVRELRDAHLTDARIEASAVSERMTIFMVVPALVFAGFFLAPPMLRLLAG